MNWKGNTIVVEPPKRPKKLTATRFATVLGLNPWETPFATWCEITKTYQKPFEETKYTAAGKVIEPLQIDYMRKAYFMRNIVTPTDLYGADYFNITHGDFFGDERIFGGMWDSLLYVNDKPDTVLEFKTTKRVEDWADGKIPEYYALQAALYAYLLGVDKVIMVASFLSEKDYDAPEKFKPSVKNTVTRTFKVSERYPFFVDEYVIPAVKWWNNHVETGISPEFDEKKDAEILKVLRTNNINPDTKLDDLITEAEALQEELDANAAAFSEKKKRLENVKNQIKAVIQMNFRDGDKKVSVRGRMYDWTLSRSVSSEIDKDRLKADGLLDLYSKPKETFTLKPSIIKEEE